LWPTLARFDTGYNPLTGVTERRLADRAAAPGRDKLG
jgi:hypothetical protein